MTKMIYSDKVFHREVVHGLSALSDVCYYDNVLCGVASGDVEVYSFGIAGACGQEFSFYYRDWEKMKDKDINLCSEISSKILLAMALSANKGWGHANEKCFVPLSSNYDGIDYIEEE